MVGVVLDPFHGSARRTPDVALYAAAVTAWFLAARSFGGRAAFHPSPLLLYPSYGILFHELSSDSVFAIAFAGWSLLAVRVLVVTSPWRFAPSGSGVALLVLGAPGQPGAARARGPPAALSSAVAAHASRRRRSSSWPQSRSSVSGPCTTESASATTPSRGVGTRACRSSAFLLDRIVRPENGPSSRSWRTRSRRELLAEEPDRSYGIHLDDFFSDPSPRMKDDLGALANRSTDGRAMSVFFVRSGSRPSAPIPRTYTRGVTRTVWRPLRWPIRARSRAPRGRRATGPDTGHGRTRSSSTAVDSPARGGPADPGLHFAGPTSPDGSIYAVWTSPNDYHLVFVHAGDEERYDALNRRIDELRATCRTGPGARPSCAYLNLASRGFPPPVVFLVLGVVVVALRRPENALALSTPAIAAIVVVVLSALAIEAIPSLGAAWPAGGPAGGRRFARVRSKPTRAPDE